MRSRKIQTRVYELYEEGYRLDWIAETLNIKISSARSFLCMERRLLGIPATRPNNLEATYNKPKKGLAPYSGSTDNWRSIGEAAKSVVEKIK